eukprot:COSAG02_NODE_5052_length_4692_cov_2.956238_2_plen_686_part_00
MLTALVLVLSVQGLGANGCDRDTAWGSGRGSDGTLRTAYEACQVSCDNIECAALPPCVDDAGWQFDGLGGCAQFVSEMGVERCRGEWTSGVDGRTAYEACQVSCANREACEAPAAQPPPTTTPPPPPRAPPPPPTPVFVTGLTVGLIPQSHEVVLDGRVQEYFDPSPTAGGRRMHDSTNDPASTFYVQSSTVINYQAPYVSADPPICSPQVHGTMRSGGELSPNDLQAMEVQYNCAVGGSTVITVTIPLEDNTKEAITWSWRKSSGPAPVKPSHDVLRTDSVGGDSGPVLTVFFGIILGCVFCPIFAKKVSFGQSKEADGPAHRGSSRGQFDSVSIETLPLTSQEQTSGNPLRAVGGSTSAAPRAEQLVAEQGKVTALIVKHGLQRFEAHLREVGATSPIHLAQLRPGDLQFFTLSLHEKRSFEALLNELSPGAWQAEVQAQFPGHSGQHQQQPAAPTATQSNGYVSFSTPSPKSNAAVRSAQTVPVAQVTPVRQVRLQDHRAAKSTQVAAMATATASTSSAANGSGPASDGGGSAKDWATKRDPVSGKPFYFNQKTNERTFVAPPVLAAQTEARQQVRSLLQEAQAQVQSQVHEQIAGQAPVESATNAPTPEPELEPQLPLEEQAVMESSPDQPNARAFFESLASTQASGSPKDGVPMPSTPGTPSRDSSASAELPHSDPFGEQ